MEKLLWHVGCDTSEITGIRRKQGEGMNRDRAQGKVKNDDFDPETRH